MLTQASELERAVEEGLRLSKRVYFGQDRAVAPPKPMAAMKKTLMPPAPMVYAVIGDPGIVDNPDMPSYQPHVHGRCDPPALIPLQMNSVSMEVECFLDTAFVTVSGTWRVHCVMGSKRCDCRIAIPMGNQGSILGVEVEGPTKSYDTKQTSDNERSVTEKIAKPEDGSFVTPNIFTLTIPQIDGGSNISIKAKWSQELLYHDGQLTVSIPYTFPEYITPAGLKMAKKEKIQLHVNAGSQTEVLCKTNSHPLKEVRREAGKLSFSYESDVLSFSTNDFVFTYNVLSSDIHGGVLLQSPGLLDSDRREMFCCFIYPADQPSRKMFKNEVVFVVDISGSMRGTPLESTKNALISALAKLEPQDLFGVIAFNGEIYFFSSSLEPVTTETIKNVTDWIDMNFVAGGGTDILSPLNQALDMLSGSQNSVPSIILITDGSVPNEKDICDVVKTQLANKKEMCPRVHTIGIGAYCNHYFLQMLALVGRGHYSAAFDLDSIGEQLEELFVRDTSIVLANIVCDFDDLDDLEVYPSQVPDLSSQIPLIISGRYRGIFPEKLKVRGLVGDMSNYCVDLKVQESKGDLVNKVVAKQQIDILTAQAWFSGNKDLEGKVAKISVQNGLISEFTSMVLLESEKEILDSKSTSEKASRKTDPRKVDDPKLQNTTLLQHFGIGFGNISATVDNVPPGIEEPKALETADILVKAASNCCGKLCSHCCCMCCIRVCSKMNDQCAIAMTQLCGALACLGCFACCEACAGNDA
ncbi:hypothetical protein LIER_14018 [Lithospermum erythrorhizon]|uniref:VWFA domain-containing protein n=1 Tax=Lithospermum erythrorhizon TaxID=34254 RepID=A0AAV3PZU2_LITER